MDLIGLYAQLACIWEATARKPGNVHRYQDFDDATYLDFLHSAAAIAPVLAGASQQGLGKTILRAIQQTASVVRSNTNLGMVLLLSPLAAVPWGTPVRQGVVAVLDGAGVDDSQQVYQAIRLARPARLGRVEAEDVHGEPSRPLRQVMTLAAERDLVARQYANGFREVFEEGIPALEQGQQAVGSLEGAIVFCQLTLLAQHPDSLIARKRGLVVAQEASLRARTVLSQGWPHHPPGRVAVEELDCWLRGDGRGRNPGTTADLVTASLFAALREGMISLPLSIPWMI